MAQEVEVKIKVNTNDAVNDVNKLGNAFDSSAQDAEEAQKVFSKAGNGVQVEQSIAGLKQLKRELKNTAVGSDEFKKLYNDIDDLEDKLKSAKNTSSDWVDSLEQAGGPIGMLGAGLNKAKVATQSFGGALKATGIGLIVSLLAGLAGAFSNNESAMKKLQPLLDGVGKLFQGIFRAVEPLFNTMVDLATDALPYVTKGIGMVYSAMMAYFTFLKESGGGALKILKGIFTLDGDAISSGIDQIGGSFKKTTTAYTDSMKRFEAGSKELTEAEKAELDKREENRKKAEEKRAIAEEKAKQKKIDDAKAEAERLQKELDLYNEFQNKIINAQIENSIKTKEQKEQDIVTLEDAFAKEQETETKNAEKVRTDKLSNIEIDLENDNISFETKKQLILDRESLLLQDQSLTEEKRKQIHKESVDAQMKIDEAKYQGQQELLKATSESLSMASDIVGKETAAGKAMAVASALINTYQGISAGVKLGYPQAIPAVLAASVTGFKAVKSILAVKTPGSSGGGGGGSISAPAPVAPSFNVVGPSGANQIAESIGGQNQQPLKAFVVGGDVSTSQALNRNIISNASIG